MSSIVVYFSHTGENYSKDGIKDLKEGHVDILAHIIADELNAPLFRLVPLVPYPHDYQSTVRRAKEEYDSGARPAFDETNMPDFAQYSDIYLGYPNWFGSFPRSRASSPSPISTKASPSTGTRSTTPAPSSPSGSGSKKSLLPRQPSGCLFLFRAS